MSGESTGEFGRFEQTHWSLIATLQNGDAGTVRAALGELLRAYYPPLRAHLVLGKRIRPDLVDDLLQGFVADRVLEKELLGQADPSKGRFRSLLVRSLDNYVRDRFRREGARRRAEERKFLQNANRSAEQRNTTPSDPFVPEWARQVLAQALKQMHAECQQQGRRQYWQVFLARVLRPLILGETPTPYSELVEAIGCDSPEQASNLLMTAKRQFLRTVRTVVWRYSIEEDEVEAEIVDLQHSLLDLSASDLGTLGKQLRPLPAKAPDGLPAIDETRAESLAELFGLQTDRDSLWPVEDMAEILRHQMSIPIGRALMPCSSDVAGGPLPAESVHRISLSFDDLLDQPHPPLDLLKAVKLLARKAIHDRSGALPTEIPTAFYFGSIALARLRHGQSITSSDDEVAQIGIKLLLRQPWIEQRLRDILQQAMLRLSDDNGRHHRP